MKKKKIIVALTSAVSAFVLTYSVAWIVFYYHVALPHLPSDFTVNEAMPIGNNYTPYYCAENAYGNYDLYHFALPKFGVFRCPIGFTSSRNYDENEGVVVNMSGSKFAYTMNAQIRWSGELKRFFISANYYASPDVQTPRNAYFVTDHNGNLLNASSLSESDRALYREAQAEILDYIQKFDEIFDC